MDTPIAEASASNSKTAPAQAPVPLPRTVFTNTNSSANATTTEQVTSNKKYVNRNSRRRSEERQSSRPYSIIKELIPNPKIRPRNIDSSQIKKPKTKPKPPRVPSHKTIPIYNDKELRPPSQLNRAKETSIPTRETLTDTDKVTERGNSHCDRSLKTVFSVSDEIPNNWHIPAECAGASQSLYPTNLQQLSKSEESIESSTMSNENTRPKIKSKEELAETSQRVMEIINTARQEFKQRKYNKVTLTIICQMGMG